ncbi:MAG: hypothetical protein RR426_04500 [Oscillospiraceae bacterium]
MSRPRRIFWIARRTLSGYVIYAMEECGFSPEDIRRVVGELHDVFDLCGLEDAEAHYQNSPY